jgi:hypothetical protein
MISITNTSSESPSTDNDSDEPAEEFPLIAWARRQASGTASAAFPADYLSTRSRSSVLQQPLQPLTRFPDPAPSVWFSANMPSTSSLRGSQTPDRESSPELPPMRPTKRSGLVDGQRAGRPNKRKLREEVPETPEPPARRAPQVRKTPPVPKTPPVHKAVTVEKTVKDKKKQKLPM